MATTKGLVVCDSCLTVAWDNGIGRPSMRRETCPSCGKVSLDEEEGWKACANYPDCEYVDPVDYREARRVEQAQAMIMLGADLEDHECDASEEDEECACGCRQKG